MSFVAVTIAVMCSGVATALEAQPKEEVLIAYTGYLPPLSIDAQRKGIVVELMELAAEKAGLKLDIRFAPWKRAQLLAENKPDSILFALARSQSGGTMFDYIAPLLFTESAFVTLDEKIDTFEEAIASNKVSGVHLGSKRKQILTHSGVTRFSEIATSDELAAMLHARHIDAWYTMSICAEYTANRLGYDPQRHVVGAPLSRNIQWLVAHKDMESDLKTRLAAAVAKVWRDPKYWQIADKYTK